MSEFTPAYLCLPISYLKKDVTSGSLAFADPRNWDDILEFRYLDCEYGKGRFKERQVACLCLSKKADENQAASWVFRKQKSRKHFAQIKLDLDGLTESVRKWAEEHGYDFFCKNVQYMDVDSLNAVPENAPLLSEFTVEDYVNLLTIKRRAFKFEDEIRLFIVGDDLPFNAAESPRHMFVDLGSQFKDFIKNVKLQPIDAEKLRSESYETSNKDVEKEQLRKFLVKHIGKRAEDNRFIVRSRLYEYGPKCKWKIFEEKNKNAHEHKKEK